MASQDQQEKIEAVLASTKELKVERLDSDMVVEPPTPIEVQENPPKTLLESAKEQPAPKAAEIAVN